jgi:hypothetical protein
VRTIVKYPTNLGYTGHAIETKSPILYIPPDPSEEEKELKDKPEIEFEAEVDNIVSQTFIKSAIYAPVIDGDGKIQGAIQLVNKINDAEIFDETNSKELD